MEFVLESEEKNEAEAQQSGDLQVSTSAPGN